MNAKDDEVYDSDNDHWIQFTDLSKYCFYYIGYFVFVYFYVIKLPEMITNNSWKTKDKIKKRHLVMDIRRISRVTLATYTYINVEFL